ncbi:MAG: response regulator [bacterium]
MTTERIPILLVDDDEDCRFLIKDAINSTEPESEIYEAASGEEAISLLYGETWDLNKPPPYLVFLDIDMPGMSGLEVLRVLKGNSSTRQIPVVMLTALDLENTKLEAAENGANSYCVKPSDPSRFYDIITKAAEYWLTVHSSSKNRTALSNCCVLEGAQQSY